MRKTALKRKSPLRSSSSIERSGFGAKPMPLKRVTPLKRTRMKRHAPKPRHDADPEYLAHLRLQPCVVCGKGASESGTEYGNDAHHPSEGRYSLALKAPDSEAFTLCPYVVGGCHYKWHHLQGFCSGWSKQKRRAFEQAEGERQRAIYVNFKATGVFAEPVRETA
jgi:hypothetical protein